METELVMKHIQVNQRPWDVVCVNSDNSMLLVNGNRCKGAAHFYHHKIYINKDLPHCEKLSTLRHELAHVFLYETQIQSKDEYTEEEMCEFMGIYGDTIVNIANECMKIEGKNIYQGE